MKLKGVNPVEQHIEKIVLVAVSAIFLIVVAMQFLFEPNAVKVGSQTVAPGRAFAAAEDQAKRLKGKIETTQLEGLPTAASVNLVEQFKAKMGGAVAPHAELAAAIGKPIEVHGSQLAPVEGAKGPVSPLVVPPALRTVAAAFRSTIDPTEPLNLPELKKLLPPEQPMDKAAVSVEGHFDGTALHKALTSGGDGGNAIPPAWWRDSMAILQVRLERQEQTGPDQWTDAAPVPTAPGRDVFGDQLKTLKATTDLTDLVGEALANQDDILRPSYYHTIAGQAWAPPAAAILAVTSTTPGKSESDNDTARLVKDVADLDKRIEQQTKQKADWEQKPVRGGGGGRESGGGKGGATGGPGGNAPGAVSQSDKDRNIKNIESRIAKFQDERKAAVDKLKAKGLGEDGKPLPPDAQNSNPSTQPGAQAQAKPLLDDSDIPVWAHDLTVEPGKTYRYRLIIGVANPLFGRGSVLTPDQQDLAKAPVVLSAASDWSEPVHVLADQYYFIVNASEADAFAPARATAEVYRFFYGYYRKGLVGIEPGDQVAAAIKLPDPNKLPIYDLTQVPQPGQQQQPTTAQPPNPGREQRRGAMPPPTGKGGGMMAPQPGGSPAGQPDQNKVVLPSNAKPWPQSTIPASADAMLLDVAKTPGSAEAAGGRSEAFLRGDGGQIVIRIPEEDRKSPVYATIAQSVKDGENQGQPTAPSQEEKKQGPRNPGPIKQPTPPPGGGGGGSGGG